MNILIEAFKRLNESFPTAAEHYQWHAEDGNVTSYSKDGINPNEAHGHVAKDLATLEKALKMYYDFPMFFGLSLDEYKDEAEKLAKIETSDSFEDSTHTGIESFLGTKDLTWGKDFIYKIRFRSKLVNKKFFMEKLKGLSGLAEVVWKEYTDNFGTDQFADVVIYKNTPTAKMDPEIVTFYPATPATVGGLIDNCYQYDELSSRIPENDSSAKLVIVDSIGKNYYKTKPGSGELRCIVVHPSYKTFNLLRDKGIDKYSMYDSGYFYLDGVRHEFKVADMLNWHDDYSQRSKVIGEARKAFDKAARKAYAEATNRTYRGDQTGEIPRFWATSPADGLVQLRNDPDLLQKFKHWGLDELDDYTLFESNISSMFRSMRADWDKE